MVVKLPNLLMEDKHKANAKKNLFFGTNLNVIVAQRPPFIDFQYPSPQHPLSPNTIHLLPNPSEPGQEPPPPGFYFPSAPNTGYSLQENHQYLCGSVYVADYDVSKNLLHASHLLKIASPPNVAPELVGSRYISISIPSMIQMPAGIPFAFRLDSDDSQIHTMNCSHTLESLRTYHDFEQIEAASVRLAKLTWGCPANGDTPEIRPIYEIEALTENDRSAARANWKSANGDGSYNLSSTVMKGKGQGTVLPAKQANSPVASSQILSVLHVLHELRRQIMPKCISKFEMEITDFHSEWNNVISSGGLEPNGTSIQMNVSSLGMTLGKSIGAIQGAWHVDQSDDRANWTLVTMLLRVGPDGDPGPFCFGRSGLYVRELGCWILWLVFNGTDPHSGFSPSEDSEAHKNWIDGILEPAWNMAGEQNRVVYVSYVGHLASNRLGSMNMTPFLGFGNYSVQTHNEVQNKNFAEGGLVSLGGRKSHANRLAREAVSQLCNTLYCAGLSLNLDPSSLLSHIEYQDDDEDDRSTVKMDPLPYNPFTDEAAIRQRLSWYAWHASQWGRLYLGIIKAKLQKPHTRDPPKTPFIPTSNMVRLIFPGVESEATSISEALLDIVKVIRIVPGKSTYDVELSDGCVVEVDQQSPRIKDNLVILNWLISQKQVQINQEQFATSDVGLGVQNATVPANLATSGPFQRPRPEGSLAGALTTRKSTQKERRALDDVVQPGSTTGVASHLDYSAVALAPKSVNKKRSRSLVEAEDQEYEAEKIIGHEMNDDGILYFKVHWKGYTDTTWEPAEALLNCLELLSDYQKLNDLPLNNGKRRLAESVQLSSYICRIDALLNSASLSSELENLQGQFGKSYYSTTTPPSQIVDLWMNQVESTQLLSIVLETLAPDSVNAPFVQFRMMQKVTSALPALHAYRQQQGIILRAVNREICRSLVVLVDWVLDIEPMLIQRLLHLHQFHGFSGLQNEAPAFALLVDHIVQYVHQDILFHVEKSSKTTKPLSYNIPLASFGQPILEGSKVPADMYGLWKCQSPKSYLTLKSQASLPRNVRNVTVSDFYDYCAKTLSAFWTTHIIIPQLRSIDQEHSKGKYKKNKDECILQRSITRGVILSCIAEVCESDGIFASIRMDDFLVSPALMFNIKTDQRFAPAIRKRRNEVLDPFRDYLRAMLDSDPTVDLKHKAKSLGEFITQRMVELYVGGPLLQEEETHEVVLQKPKKNAKILVIPSMIGVVPNTLLRPGLNSPKFELLAVIIREALNKKRSLNHADEILHAVLKGSYPTQNSSRTYNPDQTNPIREFSSGADLFRLHLPGQKLTTKFGLSNLLSWMSTGQGNVTKTFLDNISCSSGFFAESLHEMVQTFQNAMDQNAQLLASLQHGYDPTEGNLPNIVEGYVRYDDMEIWGQPNHWLSATPTLKNQKASRSSQQQKMTLTEKFAPFWNENVQGQWVKFLGGMLNQDPSTWEGKKKDWFDVLALIKNLQMNPFGRGLTLMQTGNNLVFSKIIAPPLLTHIGDWIALNPTLGAHRGLTELGFCLSSVDTVYAALGCVYDHMDTHLSDADKVILGFGTLTVEHTLCKVKRWDHRLATAKMPKYLEKCAAAAITGDPVFNQGANGTDKMALPFPHAMSDEAMKVAINKLVAL